MLPLPQKFNRFRFHIPVCNSCDWLSIRLHKLQVTLLDLLGSATYKHVQQPQQTKKEHIITTSWQLLAIVKPRTLMPWLYWRYTVPLLWAVQGGGRASLTTACAFFGFGWSLFCPHPILVYLNYGFGTSRNCKTTIMMVQGVITFKHNSPLKFSRLLAKLLTTNYCT